ncbi:MAG: hypothetical protein K2X27_16790 [Candidatus Obscuribacterales bacterium]|nr:hypothetical protein [Candidatus Obscuribacterales bacterium]
MPANPNDRTKAPPPDSKRKDITDTEAWKSSSKGVKRFWTNYKNILKNNFNSMSRSEQEDLIDKFAMIITIGVTCLVVLIFYPVIPRLLRVLGLPLALMVAWWGGRKVVGPVVIDRMEHLLKKPEREDREER